MPCRYQTRCIRTYPDGNGYALSSIEGRVALASLAHSTRAPPLRSLTPVACHAFRYDRPRGHSSVGGAALRADKIRSTHNLEVGVAHVGFRAQEYFNVDPEWQARKYAFKCHRQHQAGVRPYLETPKLLYL